MNMTANNPFTSRFFSGLGEVSAEIGRKMFYRKLVNTVGELIGADWRLVMRYTRYSVPEFLVNEGLDRKAVKLYQEGYYRLDPYFIYFHLHGRYDIVTLFQVIRKDLMDPKYFSAIYRARQIEDEVAAFLPAPGNASVVMFWGRKDSSFSKDDIQTVDLIFPAIEGLHRAHLDRLLMALTGDSLAGVVPEFPRALLVTDRDGRRVIATEGWRVAERSDKSLGEALARLDAEEVASIGLRGDHVLHAERLPSSFPIAPNGKIYFLENEAMSPIVADWSHARERLAADHNLTAREQQIVGLVLSGCPTSEIADRLGVTVGTVKNHRRRLYRKLEIKTEREIYTQFLRYLATGGLAR